MMKSVLFLAAAISLTGMTGSAAVAGGNYSGKWLVTVSNSRVGNGSYCLTLTDDGSFGWRHSGEATEAGQTYTGSFQVIKGLLVATIPFSSGTAEDGAFIFTGRARNGAIDPGEYEEVYGGEDDSGVNIFARNGC